MEVTANTLDRGFYMYQEEFEQKALEVLRSGWYVLGREVGSFESEFAAYIGCRHCVGLASGLERFVMQLAHTDNIRDVIEFPKIKDASCLMSEAPGTVDEKQLEELHLQITE